MHRRHVRQFGRARMAIALTVALATAGGFAAAGTAGAVVPAAPTTITPRSAVFTAGTADSQAVRTNGSLAGKHVTCIAYGTADCFGHLAADADGLSYGQVGNHWVVYSDGTTPVGVYRASLQGCNNVGCMQPMVFTLKVVAAPVITLQPASPMFHAGSPTLETTTITSTTPTPVSPTQITCSNCAAVLPSGLAFTNTPFADPGTAHIAGRAAAGTGGTYTVQLTATAKDKGVTTEAVTVIVEQESGFGADSLTVTAGSATGLPFTVTTNGLPPAVDVLESGALPPGIAFVDNGNGTGTFTGTPQSSDAGQYPVTLTAYNYVTDPVSETFTITVDQAPAIGAYPYPVYAHAGQPFSYSFPVTGYPAPTLTLASGALPNGTHLGPPYCSVDTLCGTPAAGTGANWFFSVKAANVAGTAPASALLQVEEAPAFTSPSSTTFVANQANTFTVTTTGGYPSPKHLSISPTDPAIAGFRFVDNGNGTATITASPAADATGTFEFMLTATNEYTAIPALLATRTQDFTITVSEPTVTLPQSAPTSDGLLAGVSILTGAGSPVTWTGSGYAPHAMVTVGMYPTSTYTNPVPVGMYTADASGTVTITGPVPNVSGLYEVVAAGYAADGRVRYLTGQTNVR